MTQSLSRELEKVGRGGTRDGRVGVPFEDLQLGMETQVEGISVETSPLHSRASRSALYLLPLPLPSLFPSPPPLLIPLPPPPFHLSPSSFPLQTI